MLHDLSSIERALADIMSDISEECYCAGWMEHLEYVLWDAVINGERKYGRELIDAAKIKRLKELSEACGCWIYFDEVSEETSMPINAWQKKYSEMVSANPGILKA